MTASNGTSGESESEEVERTQGGGFGENLRTILYAILIALVIRTVAYSPRSIPSESMLPTLLVGDYLFVSKFAYGYSRYSLPFGPPIFSGRILEGPVKRGDVVVFKLPRDNETDYIKRVIGLPGDSIQMKNGVLYLNGRAVPREAAGSFEISKGSMSFSVPQFRETLPNGVTYITLDALRNGPADNTQVFNVPEGHIFAMGDNRDNSLDSRAPFTIGVGYIPIENVIGRAEVLFYSTNGTASWWEFWQWPAAVRYDRIFDSVRASTNR